MRAIVIFNPRNSTHLYTIFHSTVWFDFSCKCCRTVYTICWVMFTLVQQAKPLPNPETPRNASPRVPHVGALSIYALVIVA